MTRKARRFSAIAQDSQAAEVAQGSQATDVALDTDVLETPPPINFEKP